MIGEVLCESNSQNVQLFAEDIENPSDDSQYDFASTMFQTSSTHSSAPTTPQFFFDHIHDHCGRCVKPRNCMERPKYSVNIPEEELYSLFLDINYHRDALLLAHKDDSSHVKKSRIDKCPVIKCPNQGCEFIFHYCKLQEHFILCKYERINCLNYGYGCPFVMQRQDVARHLKHCPANVVHCSMEWNRWPLHTTEKSSTSRVHCPSQALDTSNLDVALALRDQRMLKQLWSASRQMKRILRGRLSTHPAVPIKPYIGIRTYREYSTSAQPQRSSSSSSNPELVVVHHDEEKYIKFAQNLVETAYNESLLDILKFTAQNYLKKCTELADIGYPQRKKANSICPVSQSELEYFAPIQLSLSSSSINLPVLSDFLNTAVGRGGDGATENRRDQPPPPPPVPKCNALSLELSIWAYPTFNVKPRPMYTFRCGSNLRTDEIGSHSLDIHSSIHGGLDNWIEYRCPLFQYGCSFVIRRWSPHQSGASQQTLIYNETFEAFSCPLVNNKPPSSASIVYETPRCSNNRSSSGISNYLDFNSRLTQRRRSSLLNAFTSSASANPRISTHSSASLFSTSLGSCPPSPLWDSICELNISQLPFEVLQNICSHLDAYTLNSLSFTNQRFRAVVKTFLKKKGYVTLQWKRYELDKGKYRWSVSKKKWIFSTAISPIKGWTMNSTSAMQKHLSECPYYHPVQHKHPGNGPLLPAREAVF